MAVQEVEKKEAKGTAGINRGINNAAVGMVMDIVQAQQYQKPIPSTVRELTANAVDSQSEKEKAIEILSGKATPDKYFIRRDDALYRDSNWNPGYYSLEHLNADNNNIELIYKSKEGSGRCDRFVVRDYGVGIGSRRLQGVLEVGYSTKRNRKDALGAFGLGAKVGLATGAEYYNMTTVYNGVKYRLKIFNKKVNDLVGKFNLETEKENIPYYFYAENDSSKEVIGCIYGEETDETNYTEVEVPCLKHYKSDFDTSVKTQLLFFQNVRYFHEYEDGTRNEIQFKADVLYNSDNLIIAKDTPYAKPFVVIVNGNQSVGVCYGHIDFKELELQEMRGAIGIKCNIRQVYDDPKTGEETLLTPGVDVIASREAIRWTSSTRDYLLNKFEEAQTEATSMVENELKQDDFLKWLEACKTAISHTGSDTALGRLSNIVDLNTLRPKFRDTKIRFNFSPSILFPDFTLKLCEKYQDKDDNNKYKVKRTDLEYTSAINFESLYLNIEAQATRVKDVYLADQHGNKFVTIKPKSRKSISIELQNLVEKGKINSKNKEQVLETRLKRQENVLGLIRSSEWHLDYDDIEVPEDYKESLKKIEEGLEAEKEKQRVLTAAEKRELEQRVVANTFVARHFAYNSQYEDSFKREKVEPKIEEVKNFDGDIYYGFQVDDSKLHYAAHIVHHQSESLGRQGKNILCNDEIQLLSISKNNKNYFNMHKHIDDFFGKSKLVQFEDGTVKMTLMMDNKIVRWNTARLIFERMGDLSFFNNFSTFDNEMTQLYKELMQYARANYTDMSIYKDRLGVKEHHDDFISFLDKLMEFQTFLEEEDDEKSIAEKAKELANINVSENTRSVLVMDTEVLAKLDKLLAYAKPIRSLLNHIEVLTLKGKYENRTPDHTEVPLELKMEIEEYINLKKS